MTFSWFLNPVNLVPLKLRPRNCIHRFLWHKMICRFSGYRYTMFTPSFILYAVFFLKIATLQSVLQRCLYHNIDFWVNLAKDFFDVFFLRPNPWLGMKRVYF
jgi:hypothetical protein